MYFYLQMEVFFGLEVSELEIRMVVGSSAVADG